MLQINLAGDKKYCSSGRVERWVFEVDGGVVEEAEVRSPDMDGVYQGLGV